MLPNNQQAFTADYLHIYSSENIAASCNQRGARMEPIFRRVHPTSIPGLAETTSNQFSVILRPFKLEVWLVFVASAILLAVLTSAIEKIPNIKQKIGYVAWDIVSSVLDQCIGKEMHVVINSRLTNLLPPWFRLWMLMVIFMRSS